MNERNNWLMFLLVSAGLFALRIFFISSTMVIDDEAYYAIYSRHLSPGYIDHGPVVAYLIYGTTAIFGENSFGIRVGAVLMLTVLGVILYRFGAKRFNKRTGWVLSLTVITNVLFHTNGVVITPDAPLAFFTILAILTYSRAYHEDGKYFFVGGVFLGLAVLSKISAVFPALAIVLYPWLIKDFRWATRDVRYYISFFLAALIFMPFIYWNAVNDWAFFRYQGAHVTEGGGWKSFLELWGALAILSGPILFYYAVVKPFQLLGRKTGGELTYFSLVSVVPLAYFLIHSFLSRMELNWPAPVFFGGLFVFSILAGENWGVMRKRTVAQIVFSLVLVTLITVQTYFPFLPVHGKNDITNRYYAYQSFPNELREFLTKELNDPSLRIASNNFQIPSMINVYARPKLEATCLSIGYHETLYSFLIPDSTLINQDLIICWKGNDFPAAFKPYFGKITKMKSFQSIRGSHMIKTHTLWIAEDYRGKDAQ